MASPGSRSGYRPITAPYSDSADEPLATSRFRLPEGVSRRAVGIAVALAIEALILLALLGLGMSTVEAPPAASEITTFDASESGDEAEAEAEEETPAEAEQTEAPTAEAEPQPQAPPSALPVPPTALPRESTLPAPPPAPPPPQPQAVPSAPATPRARAVIRSGGSIGPADTGRRGGPDTEIVGTAPDGSPLYAARWFTEPTSQQLSGYLSGARGPGWGLIACKTAPNWRVEDCVVLGESPAGSNIAGAFNAASWQFLVRPPRVDGEYLVGSWVRIRLDYADIHVGSRQR